MNKDLQETLYQKYPAIFRQKDLDKTVSAMCWGISVGDGWYSLIDELCDNIQNRLRNVNRDKPESEHMICEAVQVKEKFGGLCFYTHGGDDYIDGLISMAESMSYNICAECGNKSAPQKKRGWIYTKCTPCQEKPEE
jgi:hypothetical protein